MENQNTALTTNPISEMLNPEQASIFTTFDTTAAEGEALALKCVAQADLSLTNYLDSPIVIKDIFMETISLKDKDGTEKQGLRTVIIDETNTTYSTMSESVANAIKRFMQIKHGNLSGLKVKVTTVNTRGGFKAYTLVPA